jgi:hypothetical protein
MCVKITYELTLKFNFTRRNCLDFGGEEEFFTDFFWSLSEKLPIDARFHFRDPPDFNEWDH